MQITEIDRGSEVWAAVAEATADPHTYCVRFGEVTETTAKIKVNGGCWSPPLKLRRS